MDVRRRGRKVEGAAAPVEGGASGGLPARAALLVRRPAVGAVAGQVSQAVAGLVLQAGAARFLGAAGLAAFSLIYGATVLVTAVSSGLVGDSLTVLDRAEPRVRAGLHVWAVIVAGGAGVTGGIVAAVGGLLSPRGALLLGAAVTAFVVEDALRRLLMAVGRYWSLPVVDAGSIALSLLVLGVWGAGAPLDLTAFLLALLVGQSGAAAIAVVLLPRAERPTGPWLHPDLSGVWSFGSWRAASQMVRPGLLTGVRLIVVAALGAAAYGPLEAARVYTAPTLVLVTGLGSFLLPHYVATRDRPAARSLRAADRAAMALAGLVGAITLLAVVLRPLAQPILTGGAYRVPLAAVVGWGAYAVAGALLLPYSGLATVHHRQRLVLGYRLLELAALTLVILLAATGRAGAQWAPLALAVGPVLAALGVRQAVLVPLARQPVASRAGTPVSA